MRATAEQRLELVEFLKGIAKKDHTYSEIRKLVLEKLGIDYSIRSIMNYFELAHTGGFKKRILKDSEIMAKWRKEYDELPDDPLNSSYAEKIFFEAKKSKFSSEK